MHSLCLAMLDIDHLLRLNGQFGHLAGDFALGELVKIVLTDVERPHFLARHRGGGFTLVIPGVSRGQRTGR